MFRSLSPSKLSLYMLGCALYTGEMSLLALDLYISHTLPLTLFQTKLRGFKLLRARPFAQGSLKDVITSIANI